MPIASSTGEFILRLVREQGSIELFRLSNLMTYYVLDSDFKRLKDAASSDSEMTILTGLLSEKNLEVAVESELACSPAAQLVNWPAGLLQLAICRGRVLFADQQPTSRDARVFLRNLIEILVAEDDMISWIIRKARELRIIGHWILSDGGNIQPRDVLGAELVTAGDVLIYDRYFREHTLRTLVDALEFACLHRGEQLNCDITICHGNPGAPCELGFVDYSAIPAAIERFLQRGRRVRIEKVIRTSRWRHYLHDRFIQVDSSCTFIFTAGVGCFFEGRGRGEEPKLSDISSAGER